MVLAVLLLVIVSVLVLAALSDRRDRRAGIDPAERVAAWQAHRHHLRRQRRERLMGRAGTPPDRRDHRRR